MRNKLSTGHDSTLGSYRKMAVAMFGKNSNAVKFLDEKIKSSTNGISEEVITQESQMIFLLAQINFSEVKDS